MKRIYSNLVAMLVGATTLFAQTNYTCTFSANATLDKVQVKNTVSGETKTLYNPDNVIMLQLVGQGTAVETVDDFLFLQQTSQNIVVVNLEKASFLNLTLYSSNGTFVARYANNVDAGQNAFQIGASSGVYVLVASANNQTASLKIMLTQSTQPSILEVLTDKVEPLLKSIDDVITFNKGEEFEFTGYSKEQSDVKRQVITGNTEIVFNFADVATPNVTTGTVSNISNNSAYVEAEVVSENGSTVTERGVCWGLTKTPTIDDNKKTSLYGVGTYRVKLASLDENTTYYARAYAINNTGVGYGEVVTFTTIADEGIVGDALKGIFSVSDYYKVVFAQGNLQYQASTDSWRFAEHQYDVIGMDNANISKTYDGWIDLFGWGTSGKAVKPYYNTSLDGDYLYGKNSIAGTENDWGVYNSNKEQKWRTLTGAEWAYLLARDSKQLYGYGRVNNLIGLILLPDGWVTPSSLTFTPGTKQVNTYTLEQWEIMQSYGAVFLPSAGHRQGAKYNSGSTIYYWASTSDPDGNGYWSYCLKDASLGEQLRSYGLSVRLVQDCDFVPLPNVVTMEVSNITADGAVVSGNVTSDNGSAVTERGVCWATTDNPTISDNKKASGKGTGSFSVSIALEAGYTYYVRTYAINSEGVGYGEVKHFTIDVPVVYHGFIHVPFSVSKTKKVYFAVGELNKIRSSDFYIDNTPYENRGSYDYPCGGRVLDSLNKGLLEVVHPETKGFRLLSVEEWKYLLTERPNASDKIGYAKVKIGTSYEYPCIVLLPDDWTPPSGLTFVPQRNNTYTEAQWRLMQESGAVFFNSINPFYWTSTKKNSKYYNITLPHVDEIELREPITANIDVTDNVLVRPVKYVE